MIHPLSTVARPLASVARALWPHLRRVYQERQAGQMPFRVDTDLLEHGVDATLDRLCGGIIDDTWWHNLLYRIGHPFVVVHRREHTVRALVEFINCRIARKRLKRPLQKRALDVPLRLFFPQSLPNFGWWQRGRTPGDRARGANWRVGRASHLRPPPAPSGQSLGWCHGYRVGQDRTDQY
jgi:hypothetical protein